MTDDNNDIGTKWSYEIKIGFGALSEAHDPVCVWALYDAEEEEVLVDGTADDVEDAITQVAQIVLTHFDDTRPDLTR